MNRRTVLGLALMAAPVVAMQAWPRLTAGRGLTYAPVPGLPGFRMLEGGAVSGGASGAVLVGLDGPGPSATAPPTEPGAFCAALFGTAQAALFTDPYCPNCRALEARLGTLHLAVRRHEVPVLGPTSMLAARIMVAAAMQGGADRMAARLERSRVVPEGPAVRMLAVSAGLEAGRLVADLAGPQVDRVLAEARGLYRTFGFVGTPGLVIGGTAINGDLPTARLEAALADAGSCPT